MPDPADDDVFYDLEDEESEEEDASDNDVFVVRTEDNKLLPFGACVDTACSKSVLSKYEALEIEIQCRKNNWPFERAEEEEPFPFWTRRKSLFGIRNHLYYSLGRTRSIAQIVCYR